MVGLNDLTTATFLGEEDTLENLETLEGIHGLAVNDLIRNSFCVLEIHSGIWNRPIDRKAHGIREVDAAPWLQNSDLTMSQETVR